MPLQFTTSYLEDSLTLFRYYKGLAERAFAQVTDEQLLAVLDDEMNSNCRGRQTHGWQHAIAMDGLSDK